MNKQFTYFSKTARTMCFQRLCQLLLVILLCSACSRRYDDLPAYWPVPTSEYENYGPGRFKTSYLADQIDHYYRGSAPGPIGVTTFVNIDDLYNSSTFGRVLGEQLISELTMRGFDVVELRHSDALQFIDSAGEFAMSRESRSVRSERNLSALVVGTYTVSPVRVYVNARLVDPGTSLVLSAGSVEMSKSQEIAKLLRGGSLPQSLERIPVKHIGFEAYPMNTFASKRTRDYDYEELQQDFTRQGGESRPNVEGQLPGRPSNSIPR